MDRLTTTADPLNRQFSYQYDLIGNVTRLTDRKGQPTAYAYDTLNRLTSDTDGDGSTVSLAYDSVGRLHRMTKRGQVCCCGCGVASCNATYPVLSFFVLTARHDVER